MGKRKFNNIENNSESSSNERKTKRVFSTKEEILNKSIYTCGNEIHFTASINKDSIQEIIIQMTNLINEHRKKTTEPERLNITYIVDSPGGSVTSILKFVDFINLTKEKYKFVEFTSVITGMTASAGTIMCIVADNRYMTKNAHAMVHELSSGRQSNYTHFKSYSSFLDKLHDKLVNIYCEKTGKSRKEIEKIMVDESWFTAEEYLEFGFIQKIK